MKHDKECPTVRLSKNAVCDCNSIAAVLQRKARKEQKERNMNAPMHGNMMYPDPAAKIAHSRAMKRFYNAAARLLNHGGNHYTIKTHFNPGGIAVWGETYAKVYAIDATFPTPNGKPIVEAFDTEFNFSGEPNGRVLIRQWDGRNSGHNHYVTTLEQFVTMVRELESKPFVRF